jgi:tRNA modification GTPase
MIHDTIIAIASAVGRGAIGVIRVSGPAAQEIMQRVCGKNLIPRHATHLSFLDEKSQPLDEGLAIFFPGPHSYTGEDVLELQGHGGHGVMQLLLARCLRVPAPAGLAAGHVIRAAQPGEFTKRAFMNDKLDLAQVEAVADLIDANSAAAARSAVASLQGAFSQHVRALVQQLIDLRMRVEACLDFPEEDIEFIVRESIEERLLAMQAQVRLTHESASRGAALREGLRVVLVGPPNVGKSSLLNALAEQDVALVTDIAGTTRDRIVQEITIDGVPIHVIDTAGLRETKDPVERLGIERTWKEIAAAQVVVILQDATLAPNTRSADAQLTSLQSAVVKAAAAAQSVIRVLNKADLLAKPITQIQADSTFSPEVAADSVFAGEVKTMIISAKTGAGLPELRQQLLTLAGWSGDASAGVFSARARHLEALTRAQSSLEAALTHLGAQQLELLAECLRQSQLALSEITGEFSSDDLLGEIFGRFCIGK